MYGICTTALFRHLHVFHRLPPRWSRRLQVQGSQAAAQAHGTDAWHQARQPEARDRLLSRGAFLLARSFAHCRCNYLFVFSCCCGSRWMSSEVCRGSLAAWWIDGSFCVSLPHLLFCLRAVASRCSLSLSKNCITHHTPTRLFLRDSTRMCSIFSLPLSPDLRCHRRVCALGAYKRNA